MSRALSYCNPRAGCARNVLLGPAEAGHSAQKCLPAQRAGREVQIRQAVWVAAEASRRGGVGDGSFVAFEGQPTARGRPLTKLDGVRLLSRPTVSHYYVEEVVGTGGIGIVGKKVLDLAKLGLQGRAKTASNRVDSYLIERNALRGLSADWLAFPARKLRLLRLRGP